MIKCWVCRRVSMKGVKTFYMSDSGKRVKTQLKVCQKQDCSFQMLHPIEEKRLDRKLGRR